MTHQTKAPALAGNPGLSKSLQGNNSTRRPRKCERVLAALVSGQSFNRFEAERELHDHCLHSTVSGLQRKGLVINRRYETVPGYMGSPTDVCRYWIAPESVQKAREILGWVAPLPAPVDTNSGLISAAGGE